LVEQNPENQLVGPTVEDELARACRLMGYEGRLIRDKVDFVLRLVRMKQAKEWYLDEMSCGERRRIALALSLISDPTMLLLDEPLSDLDTVGIRDTISILKEFKQRGLAIMVSSHRLEDILDLTDRVAVLGDGKILMCDEPQKVMTNSEILRLAVMHVPALQKLYVDLQKEGLLPEGTVPTTYEEALEGFKSALRKRHEPDTTAIATGVAGLTI
jgi:energy-coupling factor transporter ATP-binding protein EcfA2